MFLELEKTAEEHSLHLIILISYFHIITKSRFAAQCSSLPGGVDNMHAGETCGVQDRDICSSSSSLLPMLECRFKSPLGLEFGGFGI